MSEVPTEVEVIVRKILLTKSTKEAQDYLMDVMKIKRSSTSNYIKKLRKQLNIYNHGKSNREIS